MTNLFCETRRQLAGIRRFVVAVFELPALTLLLTVGALTSLAWRAGFVALPVDSLPNWVQMLVFMPLMGSVVTLYALGGKATVSLLLSISADIVMAPFRRVREEGRHA